MKVVVLVVSMLVVAAPTAQAQQAKPPANGTILITLGTSGGPLPRAGRTQSSNLLVVNGTPYVIDCGMGVSHQLIAAGILLENDIAGLPAPLPAQRCHQFELSGRQLVENIGLLKAGGERHSGSQGEGCESSIFTEKWE